MAGELQVGDLRVMPGEKAMGWQQVAVPGQSVEVPIFVVNGAQSGPTLVVTAGVHGAEYASIEAGLRLGRTTQSTGLRGRLIVAPIVNMPAFRARSIYVCPLDGKNLNRIFPGSPEGSAGERIANWVFSNVIRQGDYFVDLHGGDLIEALNPFANYYGSPVSGVQDTSLGMARAFGIGYAQLRELPGSACYEASRVGIPSILVESGGQGLWPESAVALLSDGLNRLMRHLGMAEGPAVEPLPVRPITGQVGFRSEHDGFYYPKVEPGQTVEAGQEFGVITDVEGNVLQRAVVPTAGQVLYVVTSLAINRGDPLGTVVTVASF